MESTDTTTETTGFASKLNFKNKKVVAITLAAIILVVVLACAAVLHGGQEEVKPSNSNLDKGKQVVSPSDGSKSTTGADAKSATFKVKNQDIEVGVKPFTRENIKGRIYYIKNKNDKYADIPLSNEVKIPYGTAEVTLNTNLTGFTDFVDFWARLKFSSLEKLATECKKLPVLIFVPDKNNGGLKEIKFKEDERKAAVTEVRLLEHTFEVRAGKNVKLSFDHYENVFRQQGLSCLSISVIKQYRTGLHLSIRKELEGSGNFSEYRLAKHPQLEVINYDFLKTPKVFVKMMSGSAAPSFEIKDILQGDILTSIETFLKRPSTSGDPTNLQILVIGSSEEIQKLKVKSDKTVGVLLKRND